MKTPRFSLRLGGASALAGALFLTAGHQSAQAGAFSLSDQSAYAVATSFSNMANPQDPSTLFTNPAGMASLDGLIQTESSYEYIHPSANFNNQGSRYSFGAPIAGSNGGGAARGASIDQTYVTATLFKNEKIGQLTLGIGATVPFGLITDYDKGWVGRYQAQTSELRTIDYDFSAAYRWKFISVGGGFDAQYASAVLSQSIDFGLAGFALGIPGFAPGRSDATLRLEGSDVSYGYNVGGLIDYLQPGQIRGLGKGTLGVSYRSGITQTLDGYATFRNVPAPFSASPAFKGQRATAKLRLPEIYNFAGSQVIADKFTVMAEATLTRWGTLSEIPINFSNPASEAQLISDPRLSNPGIATEFQDAWRYTGAIEYRPIKDLAIRIGGGYDESPIRSERVRSARVPDGDRWLVSAGLKYHAFGYNTPILPLHVDTDIELSYLHEFVNDPTINSTDTAGHTLIGKYDEQVNVASAAVIFRYGPREAHQMKTEGKDYKDHSK